MACCGVLSLAQPKLAGPSQGSQSTVHLSTFLGPEVHARVGGVRLSPTRKAGTRGGGVTLPAPARRTQTFGSKGSARLRRAESASASVTPEPQCKTFVCFPASDRPLSWPCCCAANDWAPPTWLGGWCGRTEFRRLVARVEREAEADEGERRNCAGNDEGKGNESKIKALTKSFLYVVPFGKARSRNADLNSGWPNRQQCARKSGTVPKPENKESSYFNSDNLPLPFGYAYGTSLR